MKKVIASSLSAIVFCVVIQSCLEKKKDDIISLKAELIKSDEEFSEMSKKHGMKKAFLEYIDDEGILLRPGHLPIVGADAIDFISQVNDTSYTLTWKPYAAQTSASGDLGFTYGVYSLKLPDTTLSGTYVSIWRKQPNGKWKFILDTGNEGTGGGVAAQ